MTRRPSRSPASSPAPRSTSSSPTTMPEALAPIDVAREVAQNYFSGPKFESRVYEDSAGIAVVLALVRGLKRGNVIGLRLLDFPAEPPTLRLWKPERWSEPDFDFDFSGNGDSGAGAAQAPSGAATFCVRYHVDYYKAGWHADSPWIPRAAYELLADLIVNILGGGHYD